MAPTAFRRHAGGARTLLLYAHYNTRASYYDDWLDAFRASPRFDIVEVNICRQDALDTVRRAVAECDLLVVLHSATADHVFYLEPLAPALLDRRCPLVTFIGNEVNLPGAPVADKRRVLSALQPDLIATQLLREAGEYLWGDIASVVTLPHALNPSVFAAHTPHVTRARDIGVRSFRYPAVLGDLDRNRVLDWVGGWGHTAGLVVDVSASRLDRRAWATYLDQSRGTVSTEAGSWYLQRDDALVRKALDHYRTKDKRLVVSSGSVTLRKLAHRLPWRLRAGLAALAKYGPLTYEATTLGNVPEQDVIERFFAPAQRAPVYGKCISSRHFDAVGTRTVQILLAGRYNDILRPDEHYLELAHDFSNATEIARRFADAEERDRMADGALDHVLTHHTYEHRIQQFASHLSI